MKRPTPMLWKAALFGAAAALLCSCSSFSHRWAAAPKPTAGDPFAGRWDGTWDSASRPGEGGRLQCVFTPIQPHIYEAAFHAHWKIFASDYAANFDVVRRGRVLDFRGTHQMPAIFGGMYHFSGHITPVKFTAHYDSNYDRGTFTLARPR